MEDKLKERIDGYYNSFTIHNLTRVIVSPRKESLFWLVIVITGVLLAALMFRLLLMKYYSFDVILGVRSILLHQNAFPSVTICEERLFEEHYYAYCGPEYLHTNESFNKPCNYNRSRNDDKSMINNITAGSGKIWSNGIFEISKCRTMSSGDKCMDYHDVKTHTRLNHSCFTWNVHGNISNTYGHVTISFKFLRPDLVKKSPKIIVIPHDPNVTEIDTTKKFIIQSKRIAEVKIKNSKIIRMPAPYYSKCINKASSNDLDILPGIYSRHTCLETYKILDAYKVCGDIYDYMEPFILDHHKHPNEAINKRNLSVKGMKDCLKGVFLRDPPINRCPLPCSEYKLKVFHTVSINEERGTYVLNLQMENVDSFTLFEEMPLYSISQMMSEIGGMLGLIIGASVLSFIELFICGVLISIKKIKYDL